MRISVLSPTDKEPRLWMEFFVGGRRYRGFYRRRRKRMTKEQVTTKLKGAVR